MPLLTRKAVLMAKIEGTYGTDSVPVGATDAVLARNIIPRPLQTEFVDRELVRPYLGNSERLPAARFVELEFEVEVASSGALGTAPAYGALLRACGFAQTINAGVSVVYAPVSGSFESVSIYHNQDGVRHRLLGARGTVRFVFNVRQIPVMRFRFIGLYVAVDDSALPVPTYTPWRTPVPVNNQNTPTFQLHSINAAAIPLEAIEVDLGTQLVYRSLVGVELAQITDRQAVGSARFEASTVAVQNWWSRIVAATLGNLNLVHGVGAGNVVTLASANVQLLEPTYSDSDGNVMMGVNMGFIPTGTGNNELSLTLT